ncbi:MAG: hypothetical protein L3J98_08030 [Gammaproteobacteria bacterium]|nr:hypothetical protein [Gammaproteobacteria bacterium]MCF6260097.1 hypothetical protein [Gammaproteobacteria bacterium]
MRRNLSEAIEKLCTRSQYLHLTLNISKRLFNYGLDSLERYLVEVDNALDKSWNEFADKTEKEIKSLTEEESEEYIDIIYDDISMIRDILPQINGQAQILNIYAFMEHELIRLCEQYKRANKIDVSVNDLKGGGLHSSRAYFKKVAKFDLADDDTWERLNNFNKIRNVIAHYNGYLSSDYYHYKKIKKFISTNPTFIDFKPIGNGSKSSGEIIVKSECTKQFREDVESYFEELFKKWLSKAKWA